MMKWLAATILGGMIGALTRSAGFDYTSLGFWIVITIGGFCAAVLMR